MFKKEKQQKKIPCVCPDCSDKIKKYWEDDVMTYAQERQTKLCIIALLAGHDAPCEGKGSGVKDTKSLFVSQTWTSLFI